MKILVLNPHIDAGHNLVKALQSSAVSVLLCTDIDQAWQVLQLHGSSIDLAVVHREGGPGRAQDYGLSFVFKVKGDPTQADLPIVVTSEVWGEAEFVHHQQTPTGVNAYIRWPAAEHDFISLLEAVLGTALNGASRTAATIPVPSPLASGESLLDPQSVFYGNQETNSNIVLDAPDITFGGTGILTAPKSPAEPSDSIPSAASPPPFNPSGAQDGEIRLTPIAVPGEDFSGISVAGDPGIPADSPPEFFPGEELADEELSDDDQNALAQELPYLFNRSEKVSPEASAAPLAFYHPVGDAVVPGGAATTPDIETLKKYLMLREQDVAALSGQLKSAHEQIAALENKLREEQAKNAELLLTANEQKRRIDGFEREKAVIVEGMQSETNELRFQVKARTDKAKLLEAQVREATEEMERLKERVRADIRKIRVREKELENRLEILRKDSEVLISTRENKIIELKRKLDLLEFNMDLLQNQHSKERETAAELRKRLAKAAQVVRVAGGLLGTAGAGEVLEELSNELNAEAKKSKSEREAS